MAHSHLISDWDPEQALAWKAGNKTDLVGVLCPGRGHDMDEIRTPAGFNAFRTAAGYRAQSDVADVPKSRSGRCRSAIGVVNG
jgi:hypothetical protein